MPRLEDLDDIYIRIFAPPGGLAFDHRTAARPFGVAAGRDALGPEFARRVRGEMDHETVRILTDQETALAAYRRRIEEVRAAIPPERLLVFDVAEGWQPLCRFLDVAEPAMPFPRLNSTEEWWRLVKGGPQ